jgi:hypothetical protein
MVAHTRTAKGALVENDNDNTEENTEENTDQEEEDTSGSGEQFEKDMSDLLDR